MFKNMQITSAQILPIIMIALNVGAAVVYAWQHDYRKAIYWIAAATLNAAITF